MLLYLDSIVQGFKSFHRVLSTKTWIGWFSDGMLVPAVDGTDLLPLG